MLAKPPNPKPAFQDRIELQLQHLRRQLKVSVAGESEERGERGGSEMDLIPTAKPKLVLGFGSGGSSSRRRSSSSSSSSTLSSSTRSSSTRRSSSSSRSLLLTNDGVGGRGLGNHKHGSL